MRVLVYGGDRHYALGQMCRRAFDQSGHETAYVDRSFPHRLAWQVAGRYDAGERLLQRAKRSQLLSRVGSFQPDLLLVIKGHDLPPGTLAAVDDRSNATLVNWNPDNPFQFRSEPRRAERYLDSLPTYDHVLIWDDFLVPELSANGATNVSVLPFAHDPSLHYPAAVEPQFECDVTFVGHWSEKRERYLRSLVDLDLQIWGKGWRENCTDERVANRVAGGALFGEAYTRALSSARAVVNVLGEHNIPGHNMRTFEAPASGSLTVAERTAGQAAFFTEDEEVAMYESPDELRETAERYLAADEERERVAANGREAVQPHTYAARMETLLNIVKCP
jgi:spore maturation protein CgeB